MQPAVGALARRVGGAILAALWLGTGPAPRAATASTGSAVQQDGDDEGLGPSPLHEALREARVTHAGHIRDQRLRLDRFELELTDGHLYLAPRSVAWFRRRCSWVTGSCARTHRTPSSTTSSRSCRTSITSKRSSIGWCCGSPTTRPNGCKHWPRRHRNGTPARPTTSWKTGEKTGSRGNSPTLTAGYSEELLRQRAGALRPGRAYLLADIDSKDHGWLTIEVEPNELEEVGLTRYDPRRRVLDTWMRFNILSDYGPAHRDAVLDGFAVDPDSLDDDEVTAVALGLPRRPIKPDREGWAARVEVPRTQVDLALQGNGDTRGVAALLVEPLERTQGLRLRISPVLEITDARWRPDTTGGVLEAALLVSPQAGDTEPDHPAALTGERIHFVQARHSRPSTRRPVRAVGDGDAAAHGGGRRALHPRAGLSRRVGRAAPPEPRLPAQGHAVLAPATPLTPAPAGST